jgi:8-oxo-dGTP pyrophosphatase MutT (NUDIX family)
VSSGGFVTKGEEELWSGNRLSVHRATFTDPDGEPFTREVMRSLGSVAVVAIDEDGAGVFVRQYRPAVDSLVLEVVAGTCDVDGEPLETTARRELAEEAGLEARDVVELGAFWNSPGYTDEWTTVFLATGLSDCAQAPAGVEERWLTVERHDVSDLAGLVAAGLLTDGKSIVGLALAAAALAARRRDASTTQGANAAAR